MNIVKPNYGKIVLIFFCLCSLFFTSCITYSKLRYFDKVNPETDKFNVAKTPRTIQPFDKLYIKVYSIDEKTSKIFNGGDASSAFMNVSLLSFLVNDSGKVSFPFIGTVAIAGLTVEDAGKKIKMALNQYLSNCDVTVKYIDNRVSVLGEVQRQGDYTFFEDKINIFQAIAMAGGLTRYSNHKVVTILRGNEKKVIYLKADLSDKKIVEKDYYFVQPGDVVIVEPLRAVTWSYQNLTYATILSTIATAMTVFLTIRSLK